MNNKQNYQTIDNEYAVRRSEAIQKGLTEKDKFTWQQHHDYYVKKYFQAKTQNQTLTSVEIKEYELAMIREKQGLVNPLI